MKFPIFVLLFIGAIAQQTFADGNAINPTCTPRTTNDIFDDTLIVFVFDYEADYILKSRNYILKQFACLIPITDNIKTSLLYIGRNDATQMTNAHFMDSGKLVDELQKPFTTTVQLVDTCYRLNEHLNGFKNDAFVKTHGNVHYVILSNLKYKCIGLDQNINMWSLVYEKDGNPETLKLMDDNGFLDPIVIKVATSKPLEVFVENIVSNLLHEKIRPITSNVSWLVWLFLILEVLLLISLVISWIIFVWWYRRMKRKIEKKKKNKKKNKKKAKECAVLKPVPKPEIAPKKSEIKTIKKSEKTPKSDVKTVDYDGVYKSSITKTEEMSSNIITEDASRTMKKRKDDFDDETY